MKKINELHGGGKNTRGCGGERVTPFLITIKEIWYSRIFNDEPGYPLAGERGKYTCGA